MKKTRLKSYFYDKSFDLDCEQLSPKFPDYTFNLNSNMVISFNGPTTYKQASPFDVKEPDIVETFIEKEPMLNFIFVKQDITLSEMRLCTRLLNTIVCAQLGHEFYRNHTQLFYHQSHLSFSLIKEIDTQFILLISLFLDSHPNYNIIGLKNFNISSKTFAINVMQQFCNEINTIFFSDQPG